MLNCRLLGYRVLPASLHERFSGDGYRGWFHLFGGRPWLDDRCQQIGLSASESRRIAQPNHIGADGVSRSVCRRVSRVDASSDVAFSLKCQQIGLSASESRRGTDSAALASVGVSRSVCRRVSRDLAATDGNESDGVSRSVCRRVSRVELVME